MDTIRRRIVLAGAASAASWPALGWPEANWPERPVRVIVPWAPGGITDIVARAVAAKLSASLGQQFFVDNRGGAGGNIGAEFVARAPADGYTLLLTNPGAFSTNQFLYADMHYKPSDFEPVIVLAKFPNALIVNKNLPVHSVAELVDYARKHPKALNGGSSGAGSSGHLSLEMFKSMTGAPVQNVFYKGAAPTRIDLASGRIQVVLDNIPGYLPEIRSGNVRMLAVGTRTRMASFPDVPTLEEAGVKGYESSVWYAMAAPKGTPQPVIARLNAAAQAALKAPEVVDLIGQQQGIIMGGSPEDAGRFFAEEAQRWKVIIEKSGAHIQ